MTSVTDSTFKSRCSLEKEIPIQDVGFDVLKGVFMKISISAGKRWSLDRYGSLADSDHGVILCSVFFTNTVEAVSAFPTSLGSVTNRYCSKRNKIILPPIVIHDEFKCFCTSVFFNYVFRIRRGQF
jgi:hypothetical protein